MSDEIMLMLLILLLFVIDVLQYLLIKIDREEINDIKLKLQHLKKDK